MGTDSRRNISYLIEDLENNGPAYHAWQAVYIAERITGKSNPERDEFLLDQKGLKFRPYEYYTFPPKDIRSVSISDEHAEFVMNFLGLYGINSPIPRCYHEQVAMQQSVHGAGQVPLQNFLDIFNNRFYWLYYNSWKKYRFHLYLNEGFGNTISKRVNAFIGRGPVSEKTGSSIPQYALMKFSGILSRRVRNKSGLLIILAYLFQNIKVDIKQFVPKWVKLSDIPQLGITHLLGKNSFIGESVLNYTSRICIELGPISFEEYLSFTPSSTNAKKLKEILSLYLNDGLEFDVRIKINSETIIDMDWKDERLKLGSSFWIGKPQKETCEVYYTYEEYTKAN